MVTVQAAVVQDAPVAFDLDATLDKVDRLAEQAAAGGTELVVFPEAFVSAYPRGATFGATVGQRTPEGRQLYRRYWESSVEVPGPATERIGAAAARHGMHLVIGVIECDRGTLYCTALTFGPDGVLLGKHRKLMPTGSERLVWGFGDGSTMPVHDTPIGRIGTVICWENYMPAMRMHMYSQGVQLYCAPTADPRDTWVASMQHIACEGRCFVLSANQFTRRSDYPADYPVDAEPGEVLSRGASVIVDPLGTVLAGPATDGPAILRAELDLGRIAEGKYDFDVVGHYSRPDVFELRVDRSPKHPVIPQDRAASP
ncbi:carbon-nitrogen hydrolase family protein [Saccharopolyspora indica]|uniref:carbon-nitrogen hydrolase family protein n=1 Tax=Saccharopolyspora indica TaxID=1229659 RepID=UPI0022EA1744|nr:carbon-nitrogen hydrolase family protein [Saccharopolyspora indica]MDA3648776.1 carbon-nitrogen hydrolase family protein [Saccharopolyspora indica]